MYIEVKNKDAIKAFKLLTKKLTKDGFFQKLKDIKYHRSKSQKRREKHKLALIEYKKIEKKREAAREKEEKWSIIEAKKRAKQFKKQRGAHKKPN